RVVLQGARYLSVPAGPRRPPAPACDCQGRRARLPCSDRVQNEQSGQVLEIVVKVIYDKVTDTLSIILRDGKIAESDEARPGLILDYDRSGHLVSIELLDASEQVKGPQSVEFALASGD